MTGSVATAARAVVGLASAIRAEATGASQGSAAPAARRTGPSLRDPDERLLAAREERLNQLAVKAETPPARSLHQRVGQYVKATATVMKNLATGGLQRTIRDGLGLAQSSLDVKDRIDRLQNAGDNVVLALGAGFKANANLLRFNIPVGGRYEFGYDSKVTQLPPAPGSTTPRYEVELGKYYVGMATADASVVSVTRVSAKGTSNSAGFAALGELGQAERSAVVLQVQSKDEALRAIESFRDFAAADALNQAAKAFSIGASDSDPMQHPLRANGGRSCTPAWLHRAIPSREP